MCILGEKGITQAMERQVYRDSVLKPYLSGLSGDSLLYENEVMSVLSLYSQMIPFERHRFTQEVILKQYTETRQSEKLEPLYSEVTCISK